MPSLVGSEMCIRDSTMTVYDSKGMLVTRLQKDCVNNETVHIDLDVTSGIYLLKVMKNDMILKSAKIIKK